VPISKDMVLALFASKRMLRNAIILLDANNLADLKFQSGSLCQIGLTHSIKAFFGIRSTFKAVRNNGGLMFIPDCTVASPFCNQVSYISRP